MLVLSCHLLWFLIIVTRFFAASAALVAAALTHFARSTLAFTAHGLAAPRAIVTVSSLLDVLVVAAAFIRHTVCVSHPLTLLK